MFPFPKPPLLENRSQYKLDAARQHPFHIAARERPHPCTLCQESFVTALPNNSAKNCENTSMTPKNESITCNCILCCTYKRIGFFKVLKTFD